MRTWRRGPSPTPKPIEDSRSDRVGARSAQVSTAAAVEEVLGDKDGLWDNEDKVGGQPGGLFRHSARLERLDAQNHTLRGGARERDCAVRAVENLAVRAHAAGVAEPRWEHHLQGPLAIALDATNRSGVLRVEVPLDSVPIQPLSATAFAAQLRAVELPEFLRAEAARGGEVEASVEMHAGKPVLRLEASVNSAILSAAPTFLLRLASGQTIHLTVRAASLAADVSAFERAVMMDDLERLMTTARILEIDLEDLKASLRAGPVRGTDDEGVKRRLTENRAELDQLRARRADALEEAGVMWQMRSPQERSVVLIVAGLAAPAEAKALSAGNRRLTTLNRREMMLADRVRAYESRRARAASPRLDALRARRRGELGAVRAEQLEAAKELDALMARIVRRSDAAGDASKRFDRMNLIHEPPNPRDPSWRSFEALDRHIWRLEEDIARDERQLDEDRMRALERYARWPALLEERERALAEHRAEIATLSARLEATPPPKVRARSLDHERG